MSIFQFAESAWNNWVKAQVHNASVGQSLNAKIHLLWKNHSLMYNCGNNLTEKSFGTLPYIIDGRP